MLPKLPKLPRGIEPHLLVSQVENTMPYLFAPETEASALGALAPAKTLRRYKAALAAGSEPTLDHFEYFELCISSHYLSCATPVPTDVDNQIRQKLWPAQLPLETALKMADLVLTSRTWDFAQVSTRHVYGAPGTPWEKAFLGGHLGEWFTLSCAAYSAMGQYPDAEARAKQEELFAAIADEVNRHSEIFATLWRARDGLGSLKASASVAHNLGDLDRVMDMWNLSPGDPLRLRFYKLGVTPFDTDRKLRYLGRLWVAGELYKSKIDGTTSMALENHRHYALRKARIIRTKRDFLVPNGPFFDGWGRTVAGALEDPTELIEMLRDGWQRQAGSVGYGRALRGIYDVYPALYTFNKKLRSTIDVPQKDFEKKWNDEAIRLMDDIPSRA